jgi:AcrR family transcriptional regulator
MASRTSASSPVNTGLQNDRRSTQRERLLSGMSEVAVREGYTAANVARVIAHAGVSRPTFYEYFNDREDCFLAVHRELASDLLDRVRAAVTKQSPTRSTQATVVALVEFARAEPIAARFLMHEAMAAGPGALDERDRTIAQIERIAEDARAQAPPADATPDASVRAVVGGVYRLLSLRLRRGERELGLLSGQLERWLAAYERPTREHRWRTLQAGPAPALSPCVPELAWRPPPPLARGRKGVSMEEVSHNHRERILFAAMEVACRKGYAATTIADIATAAHVDRRVFYGHFQGKQDAFLAALERGFQQEIAITASGFFSAPTWPERVWEAGQAFTHFFAVNPALAHAGFIEAYAIGPAAVQRYEELRIAYTIFLQEGHYHQRKDVMPPSPLALEVIAASVFEIAYLEIREGHTAELLRQLPNVTHLCLAPFLGAPGANAFIDGKQAG